MREWPDRRCVAAMDLVLWVLVAALAVTAVNIGTAVTEWVAGAVTEK